MKGSTTFHQLIPEGGIGLHSGCEGDFQVIVWMRRTTDTHGATLSGYLDDPALEDEGDRVRIFDKALQFAERIRINRFVLDVRLLRGIDRCGLKRLADFRTIMKRATCVLVENGLSPAAAKITTVFQDCHVAPSVSTAIKWLQHSHTLHNEAESGANVVDIA